MRDGVYLPRLDINLCVAKVCRAFWVAILVAVINRHEGHIGPDVIERIVVYIRGRPYTSHDISETR